MLIKKIVTVYFYKFLIKIRITHEELCIIFSSILIGPKKNLSTLQKKIFRKIENFSCL
ncbi:hypothetical protein FWK35_00034353 [Aphis craccivora]|uniref:Uncharacterized protein n=1 Tax=Aphis craccivora TaxID=307492 RepID=A0A6G0VX47_APHCR|nr:hypothetical protein FWK35_00034353 [Aphis craccivora]